MTHLYPEMNHDVMKVVWFIQTNFPASDLVNIAEGVAKVAPLAWGHHDRRAMNDSIVSVRRAWQPGASVSVLSGNSSLSPLPEAAT